MSADVISKCRSPVRDKEIQAYLATPSCNTHVSMVRGKLKANLMLPKKVAEKIGERV